MFNTDVNLIHTRLSIIDLSEAANQPLTCQNDKWSIVFNGEIYNYKELKFSLVKEGYSFRTNSDTEVILHGFDKWGVDLLGRLIGMFAFVIVNKINGDVFVVRDRTGVKPLYYEFNGNQFFVSSDLISLTKLAIKKRSDVNLDVLPMFLKYGYTLSSKNLVNGIKKVEPGNYIHYNLVNKSINFYCYWDPINVHKSASISELTFFEHQNNIEELLISAFEYRMVSDVPVGIFLSGGYDSTSVAALLAKSKKYNINTFSIGFENPKYDESIYAKRVAGLLGFKHKEYICTEADAKNIIPDLVNVYDEPFGDSSAIPTLLVSEFASNDVKVVLSADGGDELFGGYPRYLSSLHNFQKKNKVPNSIINIMGNLPDNVILYLISKLSGKKLDLTHVLKFKNLLKSKSILEFNDIMGSKNYFHIYQNDYQSESQISHLDDPMFSELSSLSALNSMLVYDYKSYLEADILKKVDRATMYHSIEGREPFLDHRIFEYLVSLPEVFKINNNIQKYILKEIVHKYIPKDIMERPKQGFSLPIHEWCHTDKDLKQLFFDTLNRRSVNKLSILRVDQIEIMINQYFKDGSSHFEILWYLFNYIRWFEKNFSK